MKMQQGTESHNQRAPDFRGGGMVQMRGEIKKKLEGNFPKFYQWLLLGDDFIWKNCSFLMFLYSLNSSQ